MAFFNNSPLLRHHGPGPNANFPFRSNFGTFDGEKRTRRPSFLRLDRLNGSPLSNQFHGEPSYPSRPLSAAVTPDLSRAIRFDAHLLAIVRIEDKRSEFARSTRLDSSRSNANANHRLDVSSSALDAFYSAEVVSKLRQKERTQSFINKPCSLYVTDRALIIFDRATQVTSS